MSKVFVIDVGRCTGCYNCQLACKDEHCGNDWRPYAAPQPLTGQFWMKVQENVRGTRPKLRIHYLPQLCNHCEHPACMDVCPVGAITKREDGLVLIDPDTCIGCSQCKEACPYDAIYFNEELGICQKCTGCAHLLDHGHSLPRCVDACPTDALRFGEEDELRDLIKGATVRDPESGCGPRVYYRNIPGRFIAGTVYDPVEKEVVIGAKCVLTGGGQTRTVETDDYGDFWFRELPETIFDLSITADGFEPLAFGSLSTEKDVNLGDLPMQPKK